jgi:cobalt-zinc-cadmium efflux system outer membrane protein
MGAFVIIFKKTHRMKKEYFIIKHREQIILFLLLNFVFCAAKAQELQAFLNEALQNNAELKAYELKYKIANEQMKGATALPNTTFGFGYFVSEPETRTGAQKARISVQQMVPWFGTLTARENYAASLTENAYVDLVILQRKLVLSVSLSYYKMATLHKKQEVLKESIKLLATYEELAITSVEAGNASVVDVLKIQIKQNELEAKLQSLHGLFKAEQARFRQLLNRDVPIAMVFPNTWRLPEKAFTIYKDSITIHPELEKYEKLFESVEQSLALNEKEAAPNLSFGVDYIAVEERPNLNINDNGKDIFMPMVSLSIPLFNTSYKSKARALNLKKEEITAFKKERRNRLEALLSEAFQKKETAQIQYNAQLNNIQKAEDAEEIVMKTYESGRLDFNDILDVQELQLVFQEKLLNAVEMYFKAVATINYLTNEK